MKQSHLVQQGLVVLVVHLHQLVLEVLVVQERLYSLLGLVVLLNLLDLVCQVRLEVLVRLEDLL